LKLKCAEPISNVAFNFNLRRYTQGLRSAGAAVEQRGAAGRGLHSSTSKLNLSHF
jgi:hypothetical protein